MNLCIVAGARPNFIKAAPLITAIKKFQSEYKELRYFLIHTGQHFDQNMSDVFFREMGIPEPNYYLNVASGTQGKQTGEMLIKIEEVLIQEKPDFLISIGDTNSTLAGTLAAAKLHIPIGHVEAGLRMYDKKISEELNRLISDHLSVLLFVPTVVGKEYLLKEGIDERIIHEFGDIMYDAMLQFSEIAEQKSTLMSDLGLVPKEFVLATVHRAENTHTIEHAKMIFDAFVEIAKEIKFILPLHPRTRKLLQQHNLLDHYTQHMTIVEPLGYLDMLAMEKHARLIVTDSGGVQKEAFFQKTPCATLFINTPWLELVELGWNTIVPPVSTEDIVAGIRKAFDAGLGRDGAPYGRGNSGELMIMEIIKYLEAHKQ
jgi:UDP-GlcNAc3NAcA epimerase